MIRSFLSRPLASYIVSQQKKWIQNSEKIQYQWLQKLVFEAKDTAFGKDHNFGDIKNYEDFKKNVPINDYEDLRPYIDRILRGEQNILWKGQPLYFAKTSGTTSGTKYIPITKDSISNHINSARDALLCYINETGNSQFLDKSLIFLSGSPVLEKKAGVPLGRLSGIVNHHVPSYLRTNQKPTYETNCIEDWEQKLDKIIDETIHSDMSLISGIPPWVQMYFDRLHERTNGKQIKDIFPNFSLFVYGGVNFEPYRNKIYESIGKKIDSIETFPASEGFFAYQNSQYDNSLLLLLNSGIFFEFIPAEKFYDENPPRLSISEVELNKNYALILNSNAGLWGYSIGDTIKFVSKNPYKIIFSGRIKHFISAFGEHVIGSEVEQALRFALDQNPETRTTEFTVAPQVTPKEGLPYHQWFIAFENQPNDLEKFSTDLDTKLQELNSYYYDLIQGSILRKLVIHSLPADGFQTYMKSIGKLGGQNKVPRLSNDRKIADELEKIGL
ncbi:GH3 auxin-responsive promoter-binding protein [Bernardetia litoralis DSM 6794]|uniref:GH3 auxin-responsive promoter-binding protein n=1 Tax=Bernardetia litoralis (strain ATCC 23117 / DSM 6794 / NBRC 15988 / NCIMB 1366 / Fx l1 / Sio-4) TaxID=880071 RepID=I4ANL0_BERLS|nr:GH3 auxin-responsive promoter-binding protein [Bernardetia litoralis DSM 6794]